ncbi:MAG: hypothetical protein HC908_04320 [Calothrix sp. SM1_7_51]|nr:hypothetical protein [Calothrix sp. SM1_7_51]
MYKHIQDNASGLFEQLSEQEIESVSGGFNFDTFFLQKTDIETNGSSESNFSIGGSLNGSSRQTSAYKFSQLTLGGSSFNMGGGGGGRRRRRRSQSSNSSSSFLTFCGLMSSMYLYFESIVNSTDC